jgi:hypothetical protein
MSVEGTRVVEFVDFDKPEKPDEANQSAKCTLLRRRMRDPKKGASKADFSTMPAVVTQ